MKRGVASFFASRTVRNAAIVLAIALVAYVLMKGVREGFQDTSKNVTIVNTRGSLNRSGVSVPIPKGAKVLNHIKYEVWQPAVKGVEANVEKKFIEVPYGTVGVPPTGNSKANPPIPPDPLAIKVGSATLGLGNILDMGQMKVEVRRSGKNKDIAIQSQICRKDNTKLCGSDNNLPYTILQEDTTINIGPAAFAANTWGNLDDSKSVEVTVEEFDSRRNRVITKTMKGNVRITFEFM